MAKQKLDAGFAAATRKQEMSDAPPVVVPPEPESLYKPPPLTEGQKARLEAEQQTGRDTLRRRQAEHESVQALQVQQRADALKKGKTSPDDLS